MGSRKSTFPPSELQRIFDRGEFPGRRITLVDLDDKTGRTRNVYEDLDQETPKHTREALLTLYPDHNIGMAKGGGIGTESGQIVLSHARAILDIKRMLALGYVVAGIARDRQVELDQDAP